MTKVMVGNRVAVGTICLKPEITLCKAYRLAKSMQLAKQVFIAPCAFLPMVKMRAYSADR